MDSDVCPTDQSPSEDVSSATIPVDGAPGVEITRQTIAALPGSGVEDLESYNLIEPPPLDWRSDSSSEAGSAEDLDESSFSPSAETVDKASPVEPVLLPLTMSDTVASLDINQQEIIGNSAQPVQDIEVGVETEYEAVHNEVRVEDLECAGENQKEVCDVESRVSEEELEVANRRSGGDEDHSRIHSLLNQLQLMGEEPHPSQPTPPNPALHQYSSWSELDACASSQVEDNSTETTGLLFSESHQRDLLGLLQFTEISSTTPQHTSLPHRGEVDAVVSVSYSKEDAERFWGHYGNGQQQRHREDSIASLPDDEYPEPVWMKRGGQPPEDEAAAESEQVGLNSMNIINLKKRKNCEP